MPGRLMLRMTTAASPSPRPLQPPPPLLLTASEQQVIPPGVLLPLGRASERQRSAMNSPPHLLHPKRLCHPPAAPPPSSPLEGAETGELWGDLRSLALLQLGVHRGALSQLLAGHPGSRCLSQVEEVQEGGENSCVPPVAGQQMWGLPCLDGGKGVPRLTPFLSSSLSRKGREG